MKTLKKYLSLIAIAVGLVLTSCVKDTESAGVSKLRDSKAKLNEALAAYNTAQGEAARLNAEALRIQADAEQLRAEGQKAIDLADAAYREAETAKFKALTAIDTANAALGLENARINLELAKVNLQRQQKQLEQSIQSIEHLMAKAELEYQTELKRLTADLKLAQANADAMIAQELRNLVQNYTNELAQIQSLKNQISTTTLNIIRGESELTLALIDSARFVKNYEIDQTANIRSYTASQEQYTAYLAQWQSAALAPGASALLTTKKNELKTLQTKGKGLDSLQSARDAASTIRDKKYEANLKANRDLNGGGYYDENGTYVDVRGYKNLLWELANGGQAWYYDYYDELGRDYKSTLEIGGQIFDAAKIIKNDGERYYVGHSDYIGGTGEIFATRYAGVYYVWERKAVNYYTSTGDEVIVKVELDRYIKGLQGDSIKSQGDYDKSLAEYKLAESKLRTASIAEQNAVAALQLYQTAYETAYKEQEYASYAYNKAFADYNANQSAGNLTKVNDARKAYEGKTQVPDAVVANLNGGAVGRANKAATDLSNAEAKKKDAVAVYEGLKADVRLLMQTYTNAKSNLDRYTSILAGLYPNAAFVKNNTLANLQAKIDAAWKEYIVASDKYVVLSKECNEMEVIISNLITEISNLEWYYGANGDPLRDQYGNPVTVGGPLFDDYGYPITVENYIKGRIDYYEKQINIYKESIEKANANLKDISKTSDYTYQVAHVIDNIKRDIANYKVQREGFEAQLPVREAVAANYKAAIDSLMAEE